MEEENNLEVSESERGDSIPIPVIRDDSTDSLEVTKLVENGISAPNESLHNSEIVQVVDATPSNTIVENVESQSEPETQTSVVQENAGSQTQDQLETKNELHEENADQIPTEKIVPISVVEKKRDRIGSASTYLQPDRLERNQSDIFSLKNETHLTSSIFSVNGAPSRRIYKQREVAPNNIFPGQVMVQPPCESPAQTPRDKMRDKNSYHEVKRPSSSVRNPLTGTGLISNDEYRFRGNRKKDGNPLLGVGYPEASPSNQRIPPGGFSHKLW